MSKKLLCLFLSISMLFSCGIPAFGATFSDVPENNQYYEAIDMLSEFGIILGDAGAGTFRPEDEISREEFSVIVTRILGASNIVPNMDNLPFTDVTPVTCDDWAIIATKVAYDMGIVSGYGNGKFGPKDPVTYEQVVKMLVCAIGYGPAAIDNGGWPTGYIKVANDLGITENAIMLQSANAPRGIVAQLVYNCLDVDLMETVGEGQSQVKKDHTLLTDKLGYFKGEGIVTGIPELAYDMTAKIIHEGEVEIDGGLIYNAGKTKAAEYFGYYGEFFYSRKGNTLTLVAFNPTIDNVYYEFKPESVISADSNKIVYYTDETESKIETLNIAGATYIFNSKAQPLSTITRPNIGTLKVIDQNDDEIGDLVMLDDTRIVVAGSVDAVKKIVTNKYDSTDRLNLDGETKEVEVFKDGVPSTVSAIVRDSVLMVADNGDKYTVNIITKTVSGAVESEEDGGEILGIKGKSYKVMPAYLNYMAANTGEQIRVGDEVTVYVTDKDQILYGKIKSVTTKTGYLIFAAHDTSDETARVRILNSSNKIQVLECAEKFTIDGHPYDYDEIADRLKLTNSLTNKDSGASNAEFAQLIKYTENGGKIKSILTMQSSGDSTRNLILSTPYTATKHKYNSTSKTLGTSNIILDSKTKVFKIPTDRSSLDDYTLKTGTGGLVNNTEYNFEAFDVSETGVASFIVVYGNTQSQNQAWSGIAVIGSMSSEVNSEGDPINKVTLITNGKESKRETKDLTLLSNFNVGDVIHYALTNGVITDVKQVFSPISGQHKILDGVTGSQYERRGDYYYGYGTAHSTTGIRSNNIVAGTVYSRDDTRLVIAEAVPDASGNLDLTAKRHVLQFNDNIVYYLYDSSKSKPFITTDITKEFLSTYLDAHENASKVVIMNTSYTTVRFVYIIEV